MSNTNETKTLIVTETVRYEFEVPASMPEDETTLKRFFGRQPDPWTGADFAAVTERDFEVVFPRLDLPGMHVTKPALSDDRIRMPTSEICSPTSRLDWNVQ